MTARAYGFARVAGALLIYCISRVIARRTQEQVVWIDARADIAAMAYQNTIGYRPVMNFV